jgi:hypothetical protein
LLLAFSMLESAMKCKSPFLPSLGEKITWQMTVAKQ